MSAMPDNSRCPRCGAVFRCGMTGGDGQCWCAARPPLSPLPVPEVDGGASCFCPTCLEAVRAERATGKSRQ